MSRVLEICVNRFLVVVDSEVVELRGGTAGGTFDDPAEAASVLPADAVAECRPCR